MFLAARLAIVFALMIAMVGSGFAHRIVAAEIDDSLSAYIAAGGSYADICGDIDGGHASNQTCDACRLVENANVPSGRAVLVDCQFTATNISPTFPPMFGKRAFDDPNHPTRAPPIV